MICIRPEHLPVYIRLQEYGLEACVRQFTAFSKRSDNTGNSFASDSLDRMSEGLAPKEIIQGVSREQRSLVVLIPVQCSHSETTNGVPDVVTDISKNSSESNIETLITQLFYVSTGQGCFFKRIDGNQIFITGYKPKLKGDLENLFVKSDMHGIKINRRNSHENVPLSSFSGDDDSHKKGRMNPEYEQHPKNYTDPNINRHPVVSKSGRRYLIYLDRNDHHTCVEIVAKSSMRIGEFFVTFYTVEYRYQFKILDSLTRVGEDLSSKYKHDASHDNRRSFSSISADPANFWELVVYMMQEFERKKIERVEHSALREHPHVEDEFLDEINRLKATYVLSDHESCICFAQRIRIILLNAMKSIEQLESKTRIETHIHSKNVEEAHMALSLPSFVLLDVYKILLRAAHLVCYSSVFPRISEIVKYAMEYTKNEGMRTEPISGNTNMPIDDLKEESSLHRQLDTDTRSRLVKDKLNSLDQFMCPELKLDVLDDIFCILTTGNSGHVDADEVLCILEIVCSDLSQDNILMHILHMEIFLESAEDYRGDKHSSLFQISKMKTALNFDLSDGN